LGTFWSYCYIDSVSTCVWVCVCTYRCMLVRRPACCEKNEACATDITPAGFRDLTPCKLVECHRPFGRTYCHKIPHISHIT
jgi:hypothetical protein